MHKVKLLATLVALCTTIQAWAAAEPVAVWNGDFTTKTVAGYTLSECGNTVAEDGSKITINRNQATPSGVRVTWTTGFNPLTVIVKHNGLPAHSGLVTLASAATTSTTTAAEINRAGVCLNNGVFTSVGYWQGSINNRTQGQTAMTTEPGSFVFNYNPLNNTFPKGTHLKQITSGGVVSIHAETGCVGTGDTLVGVTIGGNGQNQNSNYTDFEITGIAIFNANLTDEEIAAYQFPAQEVEVVIPPATKSAGFDNASDIQQVGIFGGDAFTFGDGKGSNWTLVDANNDKGLTLSNTVFPNQNNIMGSEDFSLCVCAKMPNTCANVARVVASINDACWQNAKTGLTLAYHEGYLKLFRWTKTGQNTTDQIETFIVNHAVADAETSYHTYFIAYKNSDQTVNVFVDGVSVTGGFVAVGGTFARTGFELGRTYGGIVNGSTRYFKLKRQDGAYDDLDFGTGIVVDEAAIWLSDESDYAAAIAKKCGTQTDGPTLTTLELEPEDNISAEEINDQIDRAHHNAVKVTLKDGAKLDLNEALTLSTKIVCSGSITLTGDSGNLANLVLSGVQGTIGRTWIEKGFGFNFNADGGSNTGAALEDTTWVSNANAYSGSSGDLTSDGLSTITWTSKNVYTDQQNSGTFVCGYLDDGNGVDIRVTNIPFKKYAVIIYATTDTPGATLSYKTVNDKNYTAGTDGIAVEGTSSWGASQSSATPSYGTNAIRINDQTNPTLVIRSVRNGTERGCISAIQIVKAGKELPTAEVEAATETATTASATYDGNTVTAKLSNLDMGEYETLQARLVISKTTDFGTTKASKLALADGEGDEGFEGEYDAETQTFTFKVSGLHANSIAHATIMVYVTDEEGEKQTIATAEISLHQGTMVYEVKSWVDERPAALAKTGVWTDGISASNSKLVVDNAAGVTFKPNPLDEYVEKCDSEFTVELYATEAVDRNADSELPENVQGGVRLVKGANDSTVELEYLDVSTWMQTGYSVGLNQSCTVKTVFHYQGLSAEDPDCVKYYVMNGTATNGTFSTTACANVPKKIISEVLVSDGTQLGYLIGSCQTEAVVVDIEVKKEIAAGQEIDLENEAEAEQVTIAIADAVAVAVAGKEDNYRKYLKVKAVQKTDGNWKAVVDFTDDVDLRKELTDDLEEAVKTVVSNLSIDSADDQESFDGKPGLFYGVVRGDEPNNLTQKDPLVLAGADGKVKISINKSELGDKHFYRVICSPVPLTVTPATK